jgi:DNA-binding XRE family transcriptional regulator
MTRQDQLQLIARMRAEGARVSYIARVFDLKRSNVYAMLDDTKPRLPPAILTQDIPTGANFGAYLKDWRAELDLTQAQVAQLLDVPPLQITRWENERPEPRYPEAHANIIRTINQFVLMFEFNSLGNTVMAAKRYEQQNYTPQNKRSFNQ